MDETIERWSLKCAFRKPADTALSMYLFFEDWFFKQGELSIEDFMNWMWFKIGAPSTPTNICSTAHHISISNDSTHFDFVFIVSWYPHRLDKNVLWLHYEDLIQNRRECVRLIAEFLDIGANDEALQELVTQQVRMHPFQL